MNKKLIYILNSYSNSEASHFYHILGLLEGLATRGIEILLIIEKATDKPSFTNSNIHVLTLKNQAGISRYTELFFILKKYIGLGYKNSFIRITAPTALVTAIAHRLFGGKSFLWISGTTLEYDRQQPLSLKKIKWLLGSNLFYKLATKAVTYFVTGPESMVDYYATVGGVRRDKIKLLYNDIDLKRFATNQSQKNESNSSVREQYNIPLSATLLLLVHRLSPVRKTDLYFPLFMKHLKEKGALDNTYIIVAGDGPELSHIQSLAREYQVDGHCRFLGKVANKEIQKLYQAANIFVHPTYNEGFPRVVIEAMASGLPIVTTDAGGTAELIGSQQRAMLSPKNAPQDFCNNLHLLIRSPDMIKQLSNENLELVRRYSTENVAKMYDEAIFNE